jgi:hypothetical protein
MKPSLLQKAAIIPVARCINFYLPGCVNLQVPVTGTSVVCRKYSPWRFYSQTRKRLGANSLLLGLGEDITA